jgi:hypothetical protein
MIEEDFRTALRDVLGPALDELSAPDVLSGVRARQVRHQRSVRAGLALSAAATVATVVATVAVWSPSESAGPAPASAVSTPAPSPSAPVVDLTGVAPLVTTGPCTGLAVAVYDEIGVAHPPLTAVTATGVVLTVAGDHVLRLATRGPCMDRLSYVQRTAAFGIQRDVPHLFVNGSGAVVTQGSRSNQTGAVELFLDCKGLVCGDSGAPLATITVKVTGTAPGAAALPFEPLPTPLTPPTGNVARVPSVIGLSVDAARQVLAAAGFAGFGVAYAGGSGPAGLVLAQDPPAGSVIFKAGGVSVTVSGPDPALSTTARMPTVVGMPVGAAEQILNAARIRYRLNYQTDGGKPGTVLHQSPVAGTSIRPETEVELTVGTDARAVPTTTGTTLTPK